jgi:hypothetical protein
MKKAWFRCQKCEKVFWAWRAKTISHLMKCPYCKSEVFNLENLWSSWGQLEALYELIHYPTKNDESDSSYDGSSSRDGDK